MDEIEGKRPNGQPYTIVICEDNESEARTLQQLLEGRGYKVPRVFCDGRSFLNWYTENSETTDLIIMDIIMSTLDGFAAFWELKKAGRLPRIVFLSAENSSQVIKHLIENGACDYIAKPYNRVKLLDRLKVAVRRPLPA